jgi:hypothetical protein
MPKDIDELRRRIGSKKVNEIKAFVKKAKASGKSPDDIIGDIRRKFSKDLEVDKGIPKVIGGVIGMVTGGGGKG